MAGLLRTTACLVLAFGFMQASARAEGTAAEGTADVSLANEVNRYLDEVSARQDDPSKLSAKWSDGIKLENSDKSFAFHIGGRFMWDTFFKDADASLGTPLTSNQDGTRFRRARLQIDGTIYKNITFSAEFEFANASPEMREVWLALKAVPGVQNIRVGHFKEPQGLEELTSSRYITMMERPDPINAFVAAFNVGMMVFGTILEDRMTYAVGVFKDSTPESGGAAINDDGHYAETIRITGVVVEDKEKGLLVHLGASFSFRDQAGGSRTFTSRPAVSTGPNFVTVTVADVDTLTVFGFEFAAAWGSLHAQGEFFLADVSAASAASPEPTFNGYYFQVAYFLTGEKRPYNKTSAKWDRIKPLKNFHDGSGGWGAWEAAVRFSNLDLVDGTVNGGEQDVLVVGINWYLNPNVRCMFNFVFADITLPTTVTGDFSCFETRVQIDF